MEIIVVWSNETEVRPPARRNRAAASIKAAPAADGGHSAPRNGFPVAAATTAATTGALAPAKRHRRAFFECCRGR